MTLALWTLHVGAACVYMKSEFAGLYVCRGTREGTCGMEREAGLGESPRRRVQLEARWAILIGRLECLQVEYYELSELL